ncbi:MAG: InlB B-repeat-containing protein, partial [Kiritimatiellae bacterium]|nr:InlB B-repeat-containing protein [Kiritimatiellia bacterium]
KNSPSKASASIGYDTNISMNFIDLSWLNKDWKVGMDWSIEGPTLWNVEWISAKPKFIYRQPHAKEWPARITVTDRSERGTFADARGRTFPIPIESVTWDYGQGQTFSYGRAQIESGEYKKHRIIEFPADQDEGEYTVSLNVQGGIAPSLWPCQKKIKIKKPEEDEQEEQTKIYKDEWFGPHQSTQKSVDPNEMAGPLGVGEQRYVMPGQRMTYTIYFENKADAAIAAQEVWVDNRLSDYLDWSTFQMGEVFIAGQTDNGLDGFASQDPVTGAAIAIAEESEIWQTNETYKVWTRLAFNPETGLAQWYIRIVDPSKSEDGGQWPDDPDAGVLQPNVVSPEGEGHITYSVYVRADAPKDAVIVNSASIVFDQNAAIETDPYWWNTVAGDPISVTFDARGNARPGGVTEGAPTNGIYYGLPTPPSCEGYAFVGWALPDGTILESLSDLPEGTERVALHALWSPRHTIAFDANGGAGEMAPVAAVGGEATVLPPCDFSYDGHAFIGWATLPDGEVRYLDGSKVSGLTTIPGATVTLYAQWADMATTVLADAANGADALQAAIDAAPDGGIVLAYPGTYSPIDTGDKAVEIRAVFGRGSAAARPEAAPYLAPAVIDGGGTMRCATLGDHAVLSGFVLANGYVYGGDGGGALGGVLEACVIEDCVAEADEDGIGGNGGGIAGCYAENCEIVGCAAGGFGGGAYHSTLTGCTVYGCSATAGAGVAGCTVRNSIVWENRLYATDKKGVPLLGNCANVTEGKKVLYKNTCTYTDSSPKPAGTGNLAKDPLFVDAANGDFRLQFASPAKDKGKAALAAGGLDLGGLPRIVGGAPDMGAHEVADGTPVPADYDGDGVADAAYFDDATATWMLMQSRDGLLCVQFGDAKAAPVPADYDGDGRADFATYSATAKAPAFRVLTQAGEETACALGLKGAVPFAADIDGDGIADPGVFQGNAKKPSFTALLSGNGHDAANARALVFGTKGAKPVAGDFDGDGNVDIGCYAATASKPAFSVVLSSRGWSDKAPLSVTLGAKGSEPCCGDFDGDGTTDFAAYSGTAKAPLLYRMFSTSKWREVRTLPFGDKGSRAATGDWDGDGAADAAIEFHGRWWRATGNWDAWEIPAP